MNYQFQSKDGEVIERWLPASQAPEFGAPLKFNGKVYHRIVSLPAVVGKSEYDDDQYPRVSRALPRNLEGCPHDAMGRPVILNKAHEREVLKKHGYTRDYSTSDETPPLTKPKPPTIKKTHEERVAERQAFDAVMRKHKVKKK